MTRKRLSRAAIFNRFTNPSSAIIDVLTDTWAGVGMNMMVEMFGIGMAADLLFDTLTDTQSHLMVNTLGEITIGVRVDILIDVEIIVFAVAVIALGFADFADV